MMPPQPRATLLHRTYFCVLCQYEYRGPKTCPQCQQHLYTTEARGTIAIGLPWVIQGWLNGSIIIDWRDGLGISPVEAEIAYYAYAFLKANVMAAGVDRRLLLDHHIVDTDRQEEFKLIFRYQGGYDRSNVTEYNAIERERLYPPIKVCDE